uniref:Uncharacterized protein n=1 Tax=Chromera velia CCMP2878 TaxID=1169474 RepID=A0A0G4H5Z0_9ALVE|eukprot:Cvel_24784.t1-p1 / transcript=Cvel_24784.t1 / gene=Cvel_24784 / organism=Chromera_velia_CCMP2878 / gene_product=hypothetical protein / transcript_product=hypothetical protein / location=Cvel_scaffold2726:14128-16850(+) / protein_length=708 / sequence_SO=supercontig / SO=protein_coding / is_pseudo=false
MIPVAQQKNFVWVAAAVPLGSTPVSGQVAGQQTFHPLLQHNCQQQQQQQRRLYPQQQQPLLQPLPLQHLSAAAQHFPAQQYQPHPPFGQQPGYGRPQQQPPPWIPSNAAVASLSHGGLWGGTPFFSAQTVGGALSAQSESSLQPPTLQSETKVPAEEREGLSTPPREKRNSSLLRTPPHTHPAATPATDAETPPGGRISEARPSAALEGGMDGTDPIHFLEAPPVPSLSLLSPQTKKRPLPPASTPRSAPAAAVSPAAAVPPPHTVAARQTGRWWDIRSAVASLWRRGTAQQPVAVTVPQKEVKEREGGLSADFESQPEFDASDEEKLPPIGAPLCSKSASGASPVPSGEAKEAEANRLSGEGREKVLEDEDEWTDEIMDDEPRYANLPYTFSPPSQQLATHNNCSHVSPRLAERGGLQRKESAPTAQQSVFVSEYLRAQILDFALEVRQYDVLLVRLCREGLVPPYFRTPDFECVRLGEEDRESWKLEIDDLLYGQKRGPLLRGSVLREYGKWGCDLGAEGLVGVRRRGDTELWARPTIDTKSEDSDMKFHVGFKRKQNRARMLCIQQGDIPFSCEHISEIVREPEKVLRSRHFPWMDEELEVYMREPQSSLLWWKTHRFEKGEAILLNMGGVFAPRRMRTRFPSDRPPPEIPPLPFPGAMGFPACIQEDVHRSPLFSSGFLFRCLSSVNRRLAETVLPSFEGNWTA